MAASPFPHPSCKQTSTTLCRSILVVRQQLGQNTGLLFRQSWQRIPVIGTWISIFDASNCIKLPALAIKAVLTLYRGPSPSHSVQLWRAIPEPRRLRSTPPACTAPPFFQGRRPTPPHPAASSPDRLEFQNVLSQLAPTRSNSGPRACHQF